MLLPPEPPRMAGQSLPVTLPDRSAPALHDCLRRFDRRTGCAARNAKSAAIARSTLSVFTSVISCWPPARAAFFQATAAVSGAGEASPLPRASDSRARRQGDCLPCGPRFNERMPEPARQKITFAEMRASGVRGRPSAFAFKYPTRFGVGYSSGH